MEAFDARFLIGLWHDCREMKVFPSPGGPLEQTAFTMQVFDLLDELRNKQIAKRQAQSQTKP